MSSRRNIAHTVGYHGSRRNGLPNIFQDVDVAMMSKLRLDDLPCSEYSRESTVPSPACVDCQTPSSDPMSSHTARLRDSCLPFCSCDESHFVSHIHLPAAQRLQSQVGQETKSTGSGDSRLVTFCLENVTECEPTFTEANISSNIILRSNAKDTKTSPTVLEARKERLVNREIYSDHTETLCAIAGECAKRPLIF